MISLAPFPENLPITSEHLVCANYPFFKVWVNGMIYAQVENPGHSVTEGGPLFHLDGLTVVDDDGSRVDDQPFASHDIRDGIFDNPIQLPPISPYAVAITHRMETFRDDIWNELGSKLPMPLANQLMEVEPTMVKTLVTSPLGGPNQPLLSLSMLSPKPEKRSINQLLVSLPCTDSFLPAPLLMGQQR